MTKTGTTRLAALVRDEAGATAIEYGLIVALIFLVIVVAISTLSGNVITMFGHISSHVGSAVSGAGV